MNEDRDKRGRVTIMKRSTKQNFLKIRQVTSRDGGKNLASAKVKINDRSVPMAKLEYILYSITLENVSSFQRKKNDSASV